MGVIMQAFYWNCPSAEGKDHAWWGRIQAEVPGLAASGFTALWLPPANKAAGTMSMGYDPYDFFDLGEFDQKGGIATWFGTKQDLQGLIAAAHAANIQVYADYVINHNSGADADEINPIDGQTRWTKFTPASGKFPRDWECFHPSRYETFDNGDFQGMPDLCHRNPAVFDALLDNATWLINDIGFDGFRFDFVKGYGGWMVRAIQELRGLHGDATFKPFAVGECWDSTRTIEDWLREVNAFTDNPASAFDFPFRYRLRDLCQSYGYSLTQLAAPGAVTIDQPACSVTFVENHDVVRGDAITQDKMLAYAVILTHPGYPCVFWQDYFNWGLALPGEVSGIEALVRLHEAHAGGDMQLLHVDDDLYIMQRSGWGAQSGLVFVLNNRGTWNGAGVQTRWSNTAFTPLAWRSGSDLAVPAPKWTAADGRGDFWAPPRGYAVYVPNT